MSGSCRSSQRLTRFVQESVTTEQNGEWVATRPKRITSEEERVTSTGSMKPKRIQMNTEVCRRPRNITIISALCRTPWSWSQLLQRTCCLTGAAARLAITYFIALFAVDLASTLLAHFRSFVFECAYKPNLQGFQNLSNIPVYQIG